ncbi:hypothetical protein PCH_Pc06g00920 [Penicillium rubens Wisconsin 54-1255]|uniref:Uncharacterized protein n=1 Tax=Penicillium rubens (strain ATCC 28089 / DSM 1075 / NRRL 1951 / Wisconsin 54-1255) TaxID=500485 RepID=B6GW31_PENRW|nr:hypothetical protein PCH_Pc06g00920 [Penicillium rubens Wisconsin 54-1255]
MALSPRGLADDDDDLCMCSFYLFYLVIAICGLLECSWLKMSMFQGADVLLACPVALSPSFLLPQYSPGGPEESTRFHDNAPEQLLMDIHPWTTTSICQSGWSVIGPKGREGIQILPFPLPWAAPVITCY